MLIVEDEFLIAAEAKRIVEEAGAAGAILVSTVAKARAALLQYSQISVCLLDVKLGSESSLPLTNDLALHGIPYIVVTGYGATAFNKGSMVITKPFRDEAVVAAILSVVAPTCAGP